MGSLKSWQEKGLMRNKQYKILTSKEWDELHVKYMQTKDPYMLLELIESLMPMIKKFAYYYDKWNDDVLEDLISVGREAVIDAIEEYDSNRGVYFTTYAYLRIKRYMYHVYNKIVQGPVYAFARSTEERRRKIKEIVRLDAWIDETEHDESIMNAFGKCDPVYEANEQSDIYEYLTSTLKPTHKEVIDMKFIEGFTYEEIGKKLGMSKQGVDSRLRNAVRQLKLRCKELGVKSPYSHISDKSKIVKSKRFKEATFNRYDENYRLGKYFNVNRITQKKKEEDK